MANDNNEICNIVKKCKVLLLDIEGTTTSISFVKDKLFPYAEENVKEFLVNKWESDDVKEAVAALRKLSLEDQEKGVKDVVAIPGEDASKEDQIEGLVKNVKWQMGADRKAGPLKQLQGMIWKQGYDKGDIKGHVYDDVQPALEHWRSVDGQKVYIYSSGSVQAQKLLFGQSVAGDLLPLINGHFDTAVGGKQEPASYSAIAEKIGCPPEEILFLTDIVTEGEAGRSSGLQVALVNREDITPPEVTAASFPVLPSLAHLSRGHKRKPDAQVDEEQPAKLLKTDTEEAVKANVEKAPETEEKAPEPELKAPEPVVKASEQDVKAPEPDVKVPEPEVKAPGPEVKASEPEVKSPKPGVKSPEPEETASEEPEKMEVEEQSTAIVSEETKEESKSEQLTTKSETVVEEVKDSDDISDIPVSDAKPIVTEEEKTENKMTEKMETEPVPEVNNADVKMDEETAPVPEDTVITEIEEITNGKDSASEGAETIEDIEPIVEEPPAVEDMEVLQSVGDVLEKECNEILSKVQDVTNLDNMPLKPLLNTITEENMDADSGDTSDIMEKILDRELELEMKQCSDIDLNTVTEMSDSKSPPDTEEANVTKEDISTGTSVAVEEKSNANIVEENKKTSDEKVEESNPTEAAVIEDSKVEKETPEKEDVKTPVEQSSTDSSASHETKESASAAEESKDGGHLPEKPKVESENGITETKEKEALVNGKSINGAADIVNQNGNSSKEEELNSRLSVENGKEVVNGANGNTGVSEQGQGDSKLETEIKVKTVSTEEPRSAPIEQPTEA